MSLADRSSVPQHIGASVAIALLSLVLAWLFFTSVFCSDDLRYFTGIARLAAGEHISVDSLAERRILFLLPGLAAFLLSAQVDLVVGAYSVFFVILAVGTHRLALALVPPPYAHLSGVAVACQPLLFRHAAAMVPDIMFSAMLLGLIAATVAWHRRIILGNSRGALGPAFLAGVFVALAFGIKESGAIYIVIPLAGAGLYVLHRRFAVAALLQPLMILAGSLAALGLEALAFRLSAGGWHSSVISAGSPPDFAGFVAQQGLWPLARFRTLYSLLDMATAATFLMGLLAAAFLVADRHSWRLFSSPRAVWVPIAAFLVWPLLYFTIGTATLKEYMPPVMQDRYYAPIVIPAILLVAGLLSRVVSWVGARPVAGNLPGTAGPLLWVVVVVALLGTPYAHRGDRGLVAGATSREGFEMALAHARDRYPGVPIVDTDSGWTTDLNRCRNLLLLQYSSGFALSARDFLDRKAALSSTYAVESLPPPPFLLVGHGDFWNDPKPGSSVAALRTRVDAGELAQEEVGRFAHARRSLLRTGWWLPRPFALRRAVRGSLSDDAYPLSLPVLSPLEVMMHAQMHLISDPREEGPTQGADD